MSFQVLPAIDLRAGRVVRLIEGDFERETNYGDDPLEVARAFAAAGARMLHLVDLDGARLGKPVQLAAIAAAAAGVAGLARCEVAGGLRTAASVAEAIGAGIDRVVIGTRALTEPAFAGDLVARYGAARVVVALDVRDGVAVGEAWRQGVAGVVPSEALLALAETGVETFEVTAIDRDGRMEGPDLALLGGLVELDRGQIIASGGIRATDDLRAVRDVGCSGAIVGRALYEGRLDLAEAIAAVS